VAPVTVRAVAPDVDVATERPPSIVVAPVTPRVPPKVVASDTSRVSDAMMPLATVV